MPSPTRKVPAVKIGVLGAARIAPAALIRPARAVDGVEVGAVAARDRARAEAFAARHGVPTVHNTYADLVADPSLDAVYIPLPNGLHAQWTMEALKSGKHVLCEKPFTSTAAQAREVAAAAEGTSLVVMEAFHYRYHPLAQRMASLVHGGELGRIKRVETAVCFPLPRFSDIRYDFGLAGGALMDAGCYAVHCLRLLAPGDPAVVSANALTLRRDRRIDRAMTAQFSLPGGASASAASPPTPASCAPSPPPSAASPRTSPRHRTRSPPCHSSTTSTPRPDCRCAPEGRAESAVSHARPVRLGAAHMPG